VQKIPGHSGKKGIEAEKCRKYPGRSGRKGMEAEKDRKYPGAAAGRVWRPKSAENTRAQRQEGYGGRKG